jgi:hypothetical protein
MVILFGKHAVDMIESQRDNQYDSEIDIESSSSSDTDDSPIQEYEDDTEPYFNYKAVYEKEDPNENIPTYGYNEDCFEESRKYKGYLQKYGVSEKSDEFYFNELYDDHYTFVSRKRQKVD